MNVYSINNSCTTLLTLERDTHNMLINKKNTYILECVNKLFPPVLGNIIYEYTSEELIITINVCLNLVDINDSKAIFVEHRYVNFCINTVPFYMNEFNIIDDILNVIDSNNKSSCYDCNDTALSLFMNHCIKNKYNLTKDISDSYSSEMHNVEYRDADKFYRVEISNSCQRTHSYMNYTYDGYIDYINDFTVKDKDKFEEVIDIVHIICTHIQNIIEKN